MTHPRTVLLIVLASLAPAGAAPLTEPTDYRVTPYAGDRTVELLVETLQREPTRQDVHLRERLVADLGTTRNAKALPALRSALTDEDWRVRASAVAGLGRMPLEWVAADLRAALASEEDRVAAQAVRAVVAHNWAEPTAELAALTARTDPRLVAQALAALTRMGQALEPARLIALLEPAQPPLVRLEAIRNAARAQPTDALVSALESLSTPEGSGQQPALRSAALATLGRLQARPARPLLTRAANDDNPLIRAGVAEGLGYLGREGWVLRLLNDPQAPVRLAALQAVARNTDPATVDALWRNLQDPIAANHLAARDALAAIGSEAVARTAGQQLIEHAEKLREMLAATGSIDPQALEFHRRQAEAASYILGALASTEALDGHIGLLSRLPAHDPLQTQVTLSLGQIGDERAVQPLQQYHQQETLTARKWAANFGNPYNQVPYNENAYGYAVLSLARLDAPDAARRAMDTLNFHFASMRLSSAGITALDALELIRDRLEPGQLGQAVAAVIADTSYDARSDGRIRWHAARLAGRYQLAEARDALRTLLEEQRPNRELIRTAGWALQQITGTTPELPNPRPQPAEGLTIWSLD